MNPKAPRHFTSVRTTWISLSIVLIATGVVSLSLTSQSLWIDEGWTASYAAKSTLREMIRDVLSSNGSDPQMPLYYFYIWAWSKLFGLREIALRASNIPFVGLMVLSLWYVSRSVFHRPFLWLCFCLSPFLWFYVNEARPYVALMATSALSIAAALVYFSEDSFQSRRFLPWICLISAWLCCAFSLLGGFLLPTVATLILLRSVRNTQPTAWKDWIKPILAVAPLFLILGAYYGWTIMMGAGGMRERPGVGNLAFAAYEFLGFAGLGPPRNVLRMELRLDTLYHYWPWLGIGLIASSGALCLVVYRLVYLNRSNWTTLASGLLGFGLLFFASWLVSFRILGRHASTLFPIFSFAFLEIMDGVSTLRRRQLVEYLLLFILVMAWTLSDLRMLILYDYHKDDYRSAVSVALQELRRDNSTVLWAADMKTAQYYGIDFQERPLRVAINSWNRAIYVGNWNDRKACQWLNSCPKGMEVILVISKRDEYDRYNTWGHVVELGRFRPIAQPNAFMIYRLQCI